jgi:anti-sigma regulatory factor (Ser/Thr protein kinase)
VKKNIDKYIIKNISSHPGDIAAHTAKRFGISRQAAVNHLAKLIDDEIVIASGKTKARRYSLRKSVNKMYHLDASPNLDEAVEWREKILPFMQDVSHNVVDICQYGFTEILRNVTDHSQAGKAAFGISRDAICIKLFVLDFGIGIFNKIQADFGLEDPRHALLELAKGKLTSDPQKHTGEGIFFASRMFDEFTILSGTLFYSRENKGDDWLIEVEERNRQRGTYVTMEISPTSKRTTKRVYDMFAPDKESYGFTRTHVPIQLARYEGEQLVSRSQARRLLARFENFEEVLLDFKGVETIGQAFADEIFRVYRSENPNIKILWVNTTPEVENMIKRTYANIA